MTVDLKDALYAYGTVLAPRMFGAIPGEANSGPKLQDMFDAVPDAGATIIWPTGTFNVPDGGLYCNKPVRLCGMAGLDGSGSRLYNESSTGTLLSLTHPASTVDGLNFIHPMSGTRLEGLVGLSLQTADFSKVTNSLFEGWHTCLDIQNGAGWEVSNSRFRGFTSVGLVTECPIDTDAGDNRIAGNWFDKGSGTTPGGTAIHWKSGGGPRITDNKINGGDYPFEDGIRLGIVDGANTGLVQIIGNNIESFYGRGIAVERDGSTGIFSLGINVVGNWLSGYNVDDATGVFVSTATTNVVVGSNSINAVRTGIDIDNARFGTISGNALSQIGNTGVRVRSETDHIYVDPYQAIELLVPGGSGILYDDPATKPSV